MAVTQIEKVIKYYDSTVIDYMLLWTGRKDLAMHYGYYDEKIKNHVEALMKMNEVLAKFAKISKDDQVLDAGCGYGGSAIWLARNIGCEVLGITPVPYQIEKATKSAKKFNVSDKARFNIGDYTDTSFPNSSFNVIWGLESIVHAGNKKDFIQESYRLLKPQGRILISEYMLRENPPLSGEENKFIDPWLKGWAMPNLLTASEYKSLLLNAGFRNINIHDLTENVRPSLRRLERLLWWRAISAKFVYKLGVISPEHYGNVEASDCQVKSLKRGLWKYIVITAEKP